MRINGREVPADFLEAIRRFRFIDDTFFTVCFDGFLAGLQLILRIILQRDDLAVKEVVTQRSAPNLYGRSIRFDVLAEDANGKLYDCEIQRADEGANPLRARFNSSALDSRELAKGTDVKNLPETWVIFITENDVLGDGLPLYHIDCFIHETKKSFNDKGHIVYVNGAFQDGSALGKLMQDFFANKPEEMNYKVLADRMAFFKEQEKGVSSMCRMMEEDGRNRRKRLV